jgi:hypothetical protein
MAYPSLDLGKRRSLRALALAVPASVAIFAVACASGDTTIGSPSSGAGGASHGATTSVTGAGGAAMNPCPPCLQDSDCMSGSFCGQFGGDEYCAPDCSQGQTCTPDRVCTTLDTAAGQQASLCVPRMAACGISAASSSAASTSASASTGSGETCGALLGPNLTACCTGCQSAHETCAANGCYNGWYCNTDSCHCQAPPDPSSCGTTSSTSTTSTTTSTSSSTGSGGNGGSVGPSGGKLDTLAFGVMGDTRPPNEGEISAYPTTIITKIAQDLQAVSPQLPFAISTGDYQYSDPTTTEAAAQMMLYLTARANFTNIVFPAMGNHECTGATDSNCGTGNSDGITKSYTSFLQMMLGPINQTKPYYSINIQSTSNAWTAKFVFIAANAWDSTQSSWLSSTLSQATTYTFVVRHEDSTSPTTPGVNPSETIIHQHPYTIEICGHTHTYAHYASEHLVVVGNGGAPLTGSINYGYVVARQRSSDGAMLFQSFDYDTNAMIDNFAITPTGSATQ